MLVGHGGPAERHGPEWRGWVPSAGRCCFGRRSWRAHGQSRRTLELFACDLKPTAARGLRSAANCIGTCLCAPRLRLRVHEGSASVQACADGIPWLGFVVNPQHRRVKSRKVVQATRRLGERHAAWRAGEISFAEFDASVQGWINHVSSADTWGLRWHVLGKLPLKGMALRCGTPGRG